MRFSGFYELISHWAERQPDAPALVFDRGGRQTMSYAQLREAVDRRAEALRADGGSCLALLCDGSLENVLEIFAAVRAGLQVVLLDALAPEDVLRALVSYTDADRLWGDEELREALSGALASGVTDGRGKLLFFTSGTTERSKAVVLTEQSLCASAWNGSAKLPLSPDDTLLCVLPLGHVFGFVCGLLWALHCGAAVALGRGARHYADDCAFFRPTAVSVVPLLLGFFVQHRCMNEELKLILVGAGDCRESILRAAASMGKRVCFGYGLTETSSGVAISVEGDPFAMEVCPDDEIRLDEDGEILISAPTCLMQGYYKRPEATATALRGGWLHTGDLGRFDAEGRLHITGRKKETIVLSDGTKLFLPEYEQELAAALGTTELAVAAVKSAPVLVLYVPGLDRQTALKQLSPLMADRPRGQQLRDVIFYPCPLPRTATGKLKRYEIDAYLEGRK